MSPLRRYLGLDPGSTTAGQLRVTNTSDLSQKIRLSTEIFSVINEDYDYNFSSSDSTSWVKFVDSEILLSPKETKPVAYSIAVPLEATPGGHYFALIASEQKQSTNDSIGEISRVSSFVYLEVSGAITKKSELLSFDSANYASKPDIDAYLRVANQGNTHSRARISIISQRIPWGKKTELTSVEPLTMPATVRRVATQLSLPTIPGLYKVSAIYAPPQGGKNVLSHYVLYVPHWLAALGTICFILFVVLCFIIWRTKRHKISKKH